MSDEVTPSGLIWSPCPDCGGASVLHPEIPTYDADGARVPVCGVCEGTGRVLVPLEDVRTVEPTPRTEIESSARQDASDAQESPREDAEQVQDVSQLFGGKGPSEAARLRWEKERARQAEQEAVETGSDVIVRTTVPVQAIIRKLSADAQKGSHQAARELRAWLSEVAVEARTSLEDLDARTRQALLARLLAEIDAEQQPIASLHEEGDGQVDHVPPGPSADATPPSVGVPGRNLREAPIVRDGAESQAASAASDQAQESHRE